MNSDIINGIISRIANIYICSYILDAGVNRAGVNRAGVDERTQ